MDFILVLRFLGRVQEMPAARDQRISVASIVEAGREAAALILGMMWAGWGRHTNH